MKTVFTYLIFLVGSFTGLSQTTTPKVQLDTLIVQPLQFDETSIERYKNNDTFNYELTKNEPGIIELAWNWFMRMLTKLLRYLFDDIEPAMGFLQLVFRVLPYIISIVALYFILKFFLDLDQKRRKKNEKHADLININDDEVLIQNANLLQLKDDAVRQQEYRFAIRYFYVYTLQRLSERGHIAWQPEKTNEDYTRELATSSLLGTFKQVTYIYDFVWYGSFAIDKEGYLEAATYFNTLHTAIDG